MALTDGGSTTRTRTARRLTSVSSLEQLKRLFGGTAPNSLVQILTSSMFTGAGAKYILDPGFYKQLQSGLLQAEKDTGTPVSLLARGQVYAQPAATPGPDPLSTAMSEIARSMAAAQSASAGSDRAALDLQREMFEKELAFKREQEAFRQKDVTTQRLLEAAGLATSPAGAIQLAFMARGQGAPNEQVRSLFQSLPFVQALLRGQALPGFGLPEQLGATTARTQNVTTGGTFGLTLPSQTGVTQQQFEGLSDFEKTFLGKLVEAEKGTPAEQYLAGLTKSFLPTTSSF